MKRKYWIYFFLGSCPVCGSDDSYKERRYGRKPKRWANRHEVIPDQITYDYCDVRGSL